MQPPQLFPPKLTPEQIFADLEGVACLMLANKIPWLVQASQQEADRLNPVWDMIEAKTSREAALLYAATKAKAEGFIPPFWVHVAPVANCLRHENGQPIVCRSFKIVPLPQLTVSE